MLNNETWMRLGLLALLLAPCAALVLWAYYAEPNTEVTPETAHPMGEPLHFTTDEYETDTVFELPPDHEAVRQIREAMAGKVVKCAVCHVEFPDLYRVQFADGSAFCCHVCAALLRAGSPT